jgi:hypothetical protein
VCVSRCRVINVCRIQNDREADINEATALAVNIRFSIPRGFCELIVFDARLYICVRRIDEPA